MRYINTVGPIKVRVVWTFTTIIWCEYFTLHCMTCLISCECVWLTLWLWFVNNWFFTTVSIWTDICTITTTNSVNCILTFTIKLLVLRKILFSTSLQSQKCIWRVLTWCGHWRCCGTEIEKVWSHGLNSNYFKIFLSIFWLVFIDDFTSGHRIQKLHKGQC